MKRAKRSKRKTSRDAWLALGGLAVLWWLARRSSSGGVLRDLKDRVDVIVEKTSQQGGRAEGSSGVDDVD